MILVDSSAWIDFLADRTTPWAQAVSSASLAGDIVVGDLILAEVLQGIQYERELTNAQRVLRMFPQEVLCSPSIAEDAAANYRLLRKRGITIRGTIDVIIATWCIANDVPIIHNDRDMAVMERELGLVSFRA